MFLDSMRRAMQDHRTRAPMTRTFIVTGLILFSLSLALSKSASNIVIALFCLAAVIHLTRSRDRLNIGSTWVTQPLSVPLAIYSGVAVVGIFYSERMADGLGIVNKMAGMVLVYLMTAALLDGEERERAGKGLPVLLLLSFVAGMYILDLIGCLTYFGVMGDRKYFLPIYPLHVWHIWFANMNALAFYVSGLLLLDRDAGLSVRGKVFLAFFLPLGLLFMLLSLSRTSWFGFLITVVVTSFFLLRDKKKYYLALAALLAAGISMYFMNHMVHARIDQISRDIGMLLAGNAETAVGERLIMWKAAFRMFLSNPLFGVGTGDYVATMSRYISSGDIPSYFAQFNQPHNIYLFALATNGLLGLGALLYLLYRILSAAWRLQRGEGSSRLYGLLALAVAVHFMAGGMTDSFFNIQMLRYTFAFLIGLCLRSSTIIKPLK
jgi:O-antigen ligase